MPFSFMGWSAVIRGHTRYSAPGGSRIADISTEIASAWTNARGHRCRIATVRTSSRISPEDGTRTGHTADGTLEALLGLAARGDQDAFETVCRQIAAPVFGIVRSVVRDPFQSEEVAQEVLIEVWRAATRFDADRGSALAWVATIAHRRAVDRVRSEHRSTGREQRAASHSVPYDEVTETVLASLDAERVRRCLASLTERQREAVTLAYYGGHTHRQVAGLLGVAAGTVSTRMRDGLIRLRDCMGVQR
jgi:RNA polymerase sigma-70 factor (ECF subfamily)